MYLGTEREKKRKADRDKKRQNGRMHSTAHCEARMHGTTHCARVRCAQQVG